MTISGTLPNEPSTDAINSDEPSTDDMVRQMQYYFSISNRSLKEDMALARCAEQLYTRFYQPNHDRIKKRFYSLSAETVEDIVHEKIAQFMTVKIWTFEPKDGGAEAYVATTIRNEAINRSRQQSKELSITSDDAEGGDMLEWLWADNRLEDKWEDEAEKDERWQWCEQILAIADFTERERRILQMIIIERLTKNEMLDREKMSIGRWYKVYAKIKEKIKDGLR